ncbi:MAG: ABC transporter permease [Clostridiales Family XIII bacterium]|jgi:putative ABC transport system permease protein|nr:ABC transporter permease [Clostridiales Family XIII bacterium]
MRTIDKRLFRMMRGTLGQFVAVATVLAIGLIMYMALSISSVNLEENMQRFYANSNFADLSSEVERVSRRVVSELEGVDGVVLAEGRVSVTVPLLGTGDEADDAGRRARVRALTVSQDSEINRLLVNKGTALTKGSREALVIKQFAEARGLDVGDSLRLQIEGRAVDFSVAGIVSSPEFVYLVDPEQGVLPDNANYGVIYVDEWLGQRLFGFSGAYNDILMKLERGISPSKLDAVVERLESRLDPFGSHGVVKRKNQTSDAIMRTEIDQLKRMSSALPMIFLLIAALILAMMLGRMVKKDRQQIGIMKALGYSSREVVSHYAKYALLVGLTGGAAGALLGLALAGSLSSYYMVYFNLPDLGSVTRYEYVPLAILAACAFCLAAGLFGSRGAARIMPAESMTAEAPKPGKRILLQRLGPLWRRLSFSSKMAMKNIFRNKKRTAFVLVGVLVSYAMMVFCLSMPAVMEDMMGQGLKEFQAMDYNVAFKRPISDKAALDIPHYVDDVDGIECKIEYPFKLSSGQREMNLSVIGLDGGTMFYRFRTKEGRAVPLPEEGALISDQVARKLGVGVGDRVLLHSYLSEKDDLWVRVEGVVYQAMGVNAYMNREVLAKSFFSPGAATGVLMNSPDPRATEKLMRLPAVASVTSLASVVSLFQEYTALMNVFVLVMLALSGTLGFAIVYNAAIISLGERETEFASMRILGFSRVEIFKLSLKENNVVAIAGAALGIPLANLFMMYASDVFSTEQYSMQLRAGPAIYLQGLAATAFFITLAQIATYEKIKSLDFMAALKNRA